MHRWAVEQLNGLMAMSKEVSGARTDTLQFLALHAFLTVDPSAVKKVHFCHSPVSQTPHYQSFVLPSCTAASQAFLHPGLSTCLDIRPLV